MNQHEYRHLSRHPDSLYYAICHGCVNILIQQSVLGSKAMKCRCRAPIINVIIPFHPNNAHTYLGVGVPFGVITLIGLVSICEVGMPVALLASVTVCTVYA